MASNPEAQLPPCSRRSLQARVAALAALAAFASAWVPGLMWTLARADELRHAFDEAGRVALAHTEERLQAELAAARAEVEAIGPGRPLHDAEGRRAGALQGLLRRDLLREALPTELLGVGAFASLTTAGGQRLASRGAEAAAAGDGGLRGALIDLLGRGWRPRYTASLGAPGWRLQLEAPLHEAFRPLWPTLLRAVSLPPLLALAFATLGFALGRRLARPLWAVHAGLCAAARNEEPSEVEAPATSSEAESLIAALDRMVQSMRAARLESERDQRALRDQNQAFRERVENLSKITVTDPLTQVANRRYLEKQLSLEAKRLARHGQGLSMLVVDVDDFKTLNDTYGHAAGDAVLKEIARILRERSRETDLVARFGGDEFVVVAPDTALEGALVLAEKVRTAVAETSFGVDARPRRATISVGVAEFQGSRSSLFNAADAALYEAKSCGKNCVMAARPDGANSP